MATMERTAPVLPVSNLAAAVAHYRRLGFAVREYSGGGYGYATRDGVEIHLSVVHDLDPNRSNVSVYLFVDDADELAAQWRAAGVHVRSPVHTDWGKHEGSHVDPDGNLLRVRVPGQSSGAPARRVVRPSLPATPGRGPLTLTTRW